MFELLEKAVLTGLGAVSLSQKMAEEFLADLKDKYRISEDEGKAFLEKVQKTAKESKDRIAEMAETEVQRVVEKIGLVSRAEFEDLKKRLEALEERREECGPGNEC